MPGDPEYRDALTSGPARGRAAGINPGNRFESVRLFVLGDHLDELARERGGANASAAPEGTPLPVLPAAQVPTEVLKDDARTILNYVDPENSPDIGFRWTINPYR